MEQQSGLACEQLHIYALPNSLLSQKQRQINNITPAYVKSKMFQQHITSAIQKKGMAHQMIQIHFRY